MNLLVDAHLPIVLAGCFPDCDVLHTLQLPKGNLTPDADGRAAFHTSATAPNANRFSNSSQGLLLLRGTTRSRSY